MGLKMFIGNLVPWGIRSGDGTIFDDGRYGKDCSDVLAEGIVGREGEFYQKNGFISLARSRWILMKIMDFLMDFIIGFWRK